MCLIQNFVLIFIIAQTKSVLSAQNQNLSDSRYVSMPILFKNDDFDMCFLKHGPETLYCLTKFQLEPLDNSNKSQLWETIRDFSSIPTNYRHDILWHGICVQETCKINHNLEECYNDKFKNEGLKVRVLRNECQQDKPLQPSSYDYIVGYSILAYFLFVLLATVSPWKPGIVMEFSIINNWERLTTVSLKKDTINLKCLSAVRLLGTCNVVMVHIFMMFLTIPTMNYQFVEKAQETMMATSEFAHGDNVLHMFFMLSTWLLTFSVFKEFETSTESKFIVFLRRLYNRYVRFLPSLFFLKILESTTWLLQLSKGVYWQHLMGKEHETCKKNWHHLFLFNNNVAITHLCTPQSWHIGMDMHFFVYSFLFLFLISNRKQLFGPVMILITALHVGGVFYILYSNNWTISAFMFARDVLDREAFNEAHLSSHYYTLHYSKLVHLPGVIAGWFYGYFYYQSTVDKKPKMGNISSVLWIVSSLGMIILVTFFPRFFLNPSDYFSQVLYGSLQALVFIMSFGFFVFGITQGYGGILKRILECDFFEILARLSFGVYVYHLVLTRMNLGVLRTPLFMYPSTVFNQSILNLVLSLLISVLFTLTIEMPMMELLKWDRKIVVKRTEDKIKEL